MATPDHIILVTTMPMALIYRQFCDSQLHFLFFAVAKPGGSSDLIAYESLSIKDVIENLPDGIYIVADAAYMLTEHVIVPFTGGDRQEDELLLRMHTTTI
jgi:hypothetical protein